MCTILFVIKIYRMVFMKKSNKIILFVLAIAFTIVCCVGLVACNDGNDTPPNNRAQYAGEYKFAGFKILKSENGWGSNFVPYDGDEDDAFNECLRYFTKEDALSEANKQYYVLNADGTAVWHLPTYMSASAAPAEIMYGSWEISIYDDDVQISYTFSYGNTNYGNGGYVDFSNGIIEQVLWMRCANNNEIRYQFFGATEEGYSTDNDWEIHAIYKKVVE